MSERFPLLDVERQADLVERKGIDDLLRCPNAWALRHRFINQETGEWIRARCNRWDCLYCGPRKVDMWRQLVKAAEPTLFLTLTRSGKTVAQAARALTVFMRYLRRGSKGKGPNKIGARPVYPVEYFAVLERHKDFEQNGFHWHLLMHGVDHIPYKDIIQPGWRSATHGDAEIGHIEAIRRPQAIGYVTKYLTKAVTLGEKGVREKDQEMLVLGLDALGKRELQRETRTVEVVSLARRIRYSRNFFPERVADLRFHLFSDLEQEAMEQSDANGLPIEGNELDDEASRHRERSSWTLFEDEEFTSDIKEYRRRKHSALVDAIVDLNIGERTLSRRVINVWSFQRSERLRADREAGNIEDVD